ncbi:hypothetical protein X744_32180 [Mesorhizobium sp. LNJC372A00]|nr:hypothetical protein X745_32340 [Mesorhizobium sp. LNJC374B00]ESY49740.1 hypothetical protein X744_32180 [Mesorhizobium sp. LNJC372A00]
MRRLLRARQVVDVFTKRGQRLDIPMEAQLVEYLFEPGGAVGGRLLGQLSPGAKDGAGGAGINAGRAQVPGVAQGEFVL